MTDPAPAPGRDRALAFIESNMTGTGVQALRLARDMGLNPLFVTNGMEKYETDPATAGAIRELAAGIRVCDTQDPDAVEKELRAHALPVCGVVTVMEYYVPLATEAARRLGLPGLDPGAAQDARNKLRTRERCAVAGVPVPRFHFVLTEEEIDTALADTGLPCVVKPVDESASIGVELCRTRAEVRAAVAGIAGSAVNSKGQARVPGALLEQCLFGPEVSVETFTYDGRTHVLGVTDKLLGPTPHFVEFGHTFPSALGEQADAAAAVAVSALAAIGFDFGPAHVEAKLTPDGPVLIEINARTGGDFIPDLVEHALGVALLEQSLRAHSGERPDLEPVRRRGAAIRFLAGRDGTVREVPDAGILEHFPAVVAHRVKAVAGQTTTWPANSHQRLGHVMAVADTAAQAAAAAEAALCHLAPRY
ncbi:ATP-grasp domain-containing protein [Streptomyces nitrosporeus]|uniref:ATP-grasp domain-containing protein n=1 Tax=Streptomyces nitrosporeus TaxID=28894 RepID=UPI00399FB32B